MSDDSAEIPVTAAKPDTPTHVTGTDHITLIGSNEADTVEFYRDLLGMPLVLRQPNLDDPNSTHFFSTPATAASSPSSSRTTGSRTRNLTATARGRSTTSRSASTRSGSPT